MRLRGQLNPGEYVIIATRQHPGALVPALLYLLGGIAAAAFASTAHTSPLLWCLGALCALAFLLGAVRTSWRWLTTCYFLTTHRIVIRRGVMTRAEDESLYLDGLGQQWVSDRGLGQMLGYGSFYVSCQGVHHCLRYVPDPQRFGREVGEAYREHYTLRTGPH